MTGALLIDLDGVIRTWDPGATGRVEDRYGLPRGCIERAAFRDGDALTRAVTGAISDEAWREEVAAVLAAAHGPSARTAVRDWAAPYGEVDTCVLEIVRGARRAMPVALVTNATTRLPRDLAALGLVDEFDAVVNSADLGIAKPDPGMFIHACVLLGAAPPDALFVDDTSANVEAARGVGLRGHVFRSEVQLRTFLGGVLPSPLT